MRSRKLKFAIFGNTYQTCKSAAIHNVLACLRDGGAEVHIDREYYDFLLASGMIVPDEAEVFEGDDFDASFVISMGGDGTFLKAAGRVGDKEIPILGVNIGRLGFLAGVNPDEFDVCFRSLLSGDYDTECREVIMVDTDGEPFSGCCRALNARQCLDDFCPHDDRRRIPYDFPCRRPYCQHSHRLHGLFVV